MLPSECLKAISKLSQQNELTGNMAGNLKRLKSAISEELKMTNRATEIEPILREIDQNEQNIIQHIQYALGEGKDKVDRYFR
jgi:hypothetical protein